jgi:hypothetical protein
MMEFWIYSEGAELPESVEAFRMEGWNRDYAFFADPRRPKDPTLVVPRERVLKVLRLSETDDAIPPPTVAPLRHPLADAEQRAYEWWNALSDDSKIHLAQATPVSETETWWRALSAQERINLANLNLAQSDSLTGSAVP